MRGGHAESKNFAAWLLWDPGLRNQARGGGLSCHAESDNGTPRLHARPHSSVQSVPHA